MGQGRCIESSGFLSEVATASRGPFASGSEDTGGTPGSPTIRMSKGEAGPDQREREGHNNA